MALQPLIENAIFHGIESSQHFGIITIDAYDENDYLYITVRDNGIGMSEEQIQVLFLNQEKSKNQLSGIGFGNVHKRLKLNYGDECGLFVESVKGEFTCVTIKIKKEE